MEEFKRAHRKMFSGGSSQPKVQFSDQIQEQVRSLSYQIKNF